MFKSVFCVLSCGSKITICLRVKTHIFSLKICYEKEVQEKAAKSIYYNFFPGIKDFFDFFLSFF